MASPTQPRHTLQLILRMPASLQHLRMHEPRYQVVVCERHPCPLTYLAFGGLRAELGCRRRGGGEGGEVGGEDWGEEVEGAFGRGEDFVGCEGVGDG